MSETTAALQHSPSAASVDPSIFAILPDGTLLYKTYEQAQAAARRLSKSSDNATKKLSQVKYGEQYLTSGGQVVPYTLGTLVEFQVTGLIVVVLVLAGLSLACSAIGRMIKLLEKGEAAAPIATQPADLPPQTTAPATEPSIHPGLTDEQLVVLLAAAATEVIGSPVRIGKFRPLTARDQIWSAQGRSELQTHRLK